MATPRGPKADNPPDPNHPIYQAAEDGRNRKSFFSFGDEGVTATVSANGRLLRISRHFPDERTGLCVDDPMMPEPWFVVSRLNTLLNWAEDSEFSGPGIGPTIDVALTGDMVNDRWPTFQAKAVNGPRFNLQYIISDATVYQRFEFVVPKATNNDRRFDDYSVPGLLVSPDVLIRNLDFVDSANEFNEAGPNSNSYESLLDDDGNCLIREHKNFDERKTAALSIQVLDEHGSYQFAKRSSVTSQLPAPKNDTFYTIQKRSASTWISLHDNPTGESFSLIFAYKLTYDFDETTSVVPSIPWKAVSETMDQMLESVDRRSFTNDSDPTLDFFLGRNLEYILSVCSIPTADTVGNRLPCVALTCGDVDGHRVSVGASFHAFQTLMLALEHFSRNHKSCDCDKDLFSKETGPYICSMMRRIRRVCGGHVKWLFQKAQLHEGLFFPNYWVNGDKIPNWEGNSNLAQESLVNTPFQVIKACTFIKFMGKENFPYALESLKFAIEAWVQDLDKRNKLGLYAFPRYEREQDKEQTQSFYLADHALIWQAIKAAEAIGFGPEFKGIAPVTVYSSKTLQRNIIKRFTTENPQSKKRMIAVTRSPIQTRFLLRSRDTALFPAADLGFFDRPDQEAYRTEWQRRSELWRSTVDCQKHHEDNDDTNWCDPRKFALSIIMARKQKSINRRSINEMYDHAMSVLLRSSSANGLFAGWLDEDNLPISYEVEDLRDTYWEVAFEIPFVLWKYCHEDIWITTTAIEEQPTVAQSKLALILEELEQISRSSNEVCTLLRDGQLTASRQPRARIDYSMKHIQPFNNIVDDKNIVELQDEWLYNAPSFFAMGPSVVATFIGQMETASHISTVQERDTSFFVGFMINVPKSKPVDKNKAKDSDSIPARRIIGRVANVDNLMGQQRTIEGAKKRFWGFFAATPSGNKACLNTVFAEEKKDDLMQSFFERHASYRRIFTEETVAILNVWTTELHFSFYRLGTSTTDDSHTSGRPKESKNGLDSYDEMPSLPEPGKGEHRKPLAKVAMGFQFEGDFFDRYWTCRLLDADPQEMDGRQDATQGSLPHRTYDEEGQEVSFDADSSSPGLIKSLWEEMMNFRGNVHGSSMSKNSWQQRRVLELILFGRMLERMNLGATEVLNQAWLSLRGTSKTTKNDQESEYDMFLITRDSFVISRKRIEEVQRVLRTLMGNLEENLEQIELWESREKDRQAERPRWTFHDENRFRVSIQKLVVSNDHDVLKLKRVSLKISKLEESLAKKLEILRSDREEQRGGETQLFTYVTVVFLPLGFATGIFSMSEVPATQTVIGMVITAVAAFTVVALLGMFVKTIISAEVVHLPEVTNWTSQDWSKWKDGVKSHWKSKETKVQHGDTLSSATEKPGHTNPWMRRIFQRKASSDDTKEQKPADAEDVERGVEVGDFPRRRDTFRPQMTW